uniref:Uncharacterized protein n=1 Tax=Anguilla anguilla TaxID=7936 RepID=A0A0E9QUD2_ANGAN
MSVIFLKTLIIGNSIHSK